LSPVRARAEARSEAGRPLGPSSPGMRSSGRTRPGAPARPCGSWSVGEASAAPGSAPDGGELETGASWRRRPTNVLASVLKPCVAEGDGLCGGELHGLAVRAEDGRRRGRRRTGGCVRRRQRRLRVGETGRRMLVGRRSGGCLREAEAEEAKVTYWAGWAVSAGPKRIHSSVSGPTKMRYADTPRIRIRTVSQAYPYRIRI
jgi:hypothetical protein